MIFTPPSISPALAEIVIKQQNQSATTFRIAISGGSIPKLLWEGLQHNSSVQWEKWQIYFCDERLVPLKDAESNFHLAQTEFFRHTPLQPSQIHTIDESLLSSPTQCAASYAKSLQAEVGDSPIVFDLMLLGMGPDGHTCSLFPSHPLLQSTLLVDSLTDSPKPPPSRITMTLPLVNASKWAVFIVSGEGKKDALNRVFNDGEKLPCALVNAGKTWWLSDGAATSGIGSHVVEWKSIE